MDWFNPTWAKWFDLAKEAGGRNPVFAGGALRGLAGTAYGRGGEEIESPGVFNRAIMGLKGY